LNPVEADVAIPTEEKVENYLDTDNTNETTNFLQRGTN
jgi:hypothetical protein